MNWLHRNAPAIEAAAAGVTALVALAALIAIPWQIRATAELQAEQSARDIYREYVALSVNKPQFAAPDYCGLRSRHEDWTAYQYYIEYLLYTAEQVTSVSHEWAPVVAGHLETHQEFFCAEPEWNADTPLVSALIAQQRTQCGPVTICLPILK